MTCLTWLPLGYTSVAATVIRSTARPARRRATRDVRSPGLRLRRSFRPSQRSNKDRQWHMRKKLAAHSCGRSRGFDPIVSPRSLNRHAPICAVKRHKCQPDLTGRGRRTFPRAMFSQQGESRRRLLSKRVPRVATASTRFDFRPRMEVRSIASSIPHAIDDLTAVGRPELPLIHTPGSGVEFVEHVVDAQSDPALLRNLVVET